MAVSFSAVERCASSSCGRRHAVAAPVVAAAYPRRPRACPHLDVSLPTADQRPCRSSSLSRGGNDPAMAASLDGAVCGQGKQAAMQMRALRKISTSRVEEVLKAERHAHAAAIRAEWAWRPERSLMRPGDQAGARAKVQEISVKLNLMCLLWQARSQSCCLSPLQLHRQGQIRPALALRVLRMTRDLVKIPERAQRGRAPRGMAVDRHRL